ncbi:uncharacterized protein LOC107510257 [Rousettus aegyptiacus]|uniref:uncharacterized protein LOC107510257 n=1 Tax=Rousettus aegyptiacus TaxID=9407 RepID=UPI00168D44E5|nr:uncharacterized protein LOC107510257 [Rousettus aegyptiacus]
MSHWTAYEATIPLSAFKELGDLQQVPSSLPTLASASAGSASSDPYRVLPTCQSKQVSLEGKYTSRRRSGAHKGLEPLSECPVHAGVRACVRRRISVTHLVPSPHKVVRERIFGHALQNRRNERTRGSFLNHRGSPPPCSIIQGGHKNLPLPLEARGLSAAPFAEVDSGSAKFPAKRRRSTSQQLCPVSRTRYHGDHWALLLARPEQWERGLAQTPSRQGQAHDMEACTWPPSSLASLAHPDHGSDQAAGWLRGGGGRETAVRAQSRI